MSTCYSEIKVDLNNVFTCGTCHERPVFFTEDDFKAHDKRHHIMDSYQQKEQFHKRVTHTMKENMVKSDDSLVLDRLVNDMSMVKAAITFNGNSMKKVLLEIKDLLSSKPVIKDANDVYRSDSDEMLVCAERRKNSSRTLLKAQEENKKMKTVVDELRKEISDSRAQNEQLTQEISSVRSEKDQLVKEISTAKCQNNKMTREIDSFKSEQFRNESSTDDTVLELQITKRELKKRSLLNRELKLEMDDLKDEHDRTKQTLEESNRKTEFQLKCAEERYKGLLEIEKERRVKIEGFHGDREKMMNDIIVEKGTISSERNQIKIEHDSLQKQHSKLKETFNSMEEKLNETKHETEKLKLEMKSRELGSSDEVAKLQLAVKRYEGEIEIMKTEAAHINIVKAKLEQVESEKLSLLSQVQDITTSLKKATDELKVKEDLVLKLEKDLKEALSGSESKEAEIVKLKSNLDSNEEQNSKLKIELDEACENKSKLEEKSFEAKKELSSLQKDNSLLSKRLHTMKNDLEEAEKNQVAIGNKNSNKIEQRKRENQSKRSPLAAVISSTDDDESDNDVSEFSTRKQNRRKDNKREEKQQDVLNDFETPPVRSKTKFDPANRRPRSAEIDAPSKPIVTQKKKNTKMDIFDQFPSVPDALDDEPIEPVVSKKRTLKTDDFDLLSDEPDAPNTKKIMNKDNAVPREPVVTTKKKATKMDIFDQFPDEPDNTPRKKKNVVFEDTVPSEPVVTQKKKEPETNDFDASSSDFDTPTKKTTVQKEDTVPSKQIVNQKKKTPNDILDDFLDDSDDGAPITKKKSTPSEPVAQKKKASKMDDFDLFPEEPVTPKTKKNTAKNDLFPSDLSDTEQTGFFPTEPANSKKKKNSYMDDLFPTEEADPEPRKRKNSFMDELLGSPSSKNKDKKNTGVNDLFPKRNTADTNKSQPAASKNDTNSKKTNSSNKIGKKTGTKVNKKQNKGGVTFSDDDDDFSDGEFDDDTIDALLQGL